MISSGDCYTVLESHFQGDHKSHCFHAVIPAIHIIAQEEKISIWGSSCNSEEFNEIVELAVNVSADGDRNSYGLNV